MRRPLHQLMLENLTQLIKQQKDIHQLTGVEDKVERIFESIKDVLKTYRAPSGGPDESFIKKVRDVITKAEEFVGNYAKEVSESVTASIHMKPVYWIQLLGLRKQLKEIRSDIKEIRNKFQHDLQYNQASVDPQGEEDLPEYLEEYYLTQCVHHLLLFPADVEVPARRLKALWVAEGLIGPTRDEKESDEKIAERYVEELVQKNLALAKRKPNGKVKACKLADDVREILSSRIDEHDSLGNRRLVDHNIEMGKRMHNKDSTAYRSFINIHGNPNISESVPKYGDIVSFLSFDTEETNNPREDIGNFLNRCIFAGCFARLKVLDLEGVFRPRLPNTVGKLINLKYLGLRWTYLQHLPGFVRKLLNLQVLDLKHTYFSSLPTSIWSMQYLRHLYLSETSRTRFPARPSGAPSLITLQTLWGAFIDEATCVTGGPDASKQIRKLGLSCRSRSICEKSNNMSEQLKAVDNWISTLESLENLRLKSRDKQGRTSDLHLSSLKRNKELSTLYLLGRLQQSVVSEFPERLTDITLSGSELEQDPMKFLGRLRGLVNLRLLCQSVVCNKMHCSKGSFPKLKLLHIWELEKLEEWEVEEGSLPCLEELKIRSCKKLNTMHCYKGTLPNLKLLHIWKLENLEEWEIEEGSLPCLEELEIRSYNNLKPRVFRAFPASLTKITLSKSSLDLDPVEFLERLRYPVCHQVRRLSVVRDKMHCSRGDFHWLKVKMEKFEGREVEEKSLPSLEELEITSCKKLNPRFFQKLPVSPTAITLSGSELDQDPMQLLKWLPNLQYLQLLDQYVVCHKMHSSSGDFPELKRLLISKLENLEEWETEEGSLPSLKELEIRSCKKLNPRFFHKLPVSLTHVTMSGSELDQDPMQLLKRLPNLQYLQLLDQCVVCHKMHSSSGDFPKLKRLLISKLENLEEWETEEGSLPSLKELEITSCKKLNPRFFHNLPVSLTAITLSGSKLDQDPMQLLKWLPNLQYLQLLDQYVVCHKMHSFSGDFPKLKRLLISKLENLEEWEIEEGSLPSLEKLGIRSCKKLNPRFFHNLPVSLTDITMSGSELDQDPMQLLKRLQNLEYLRLLDQCVVCHKMHSSSGYFSKLKLLRISKLENLEEWEIEEGSLPSLEELEIGSCQKLKMLPDGLRHVTTLEKLRLMNMPQTFIDQTKATQPQLRDKIEVATEVGKNNPN